MRMMINTNSFTFLQIYLFLILMLCVGHSELAGNGAYCRESEQMALLQFKAELIDDYGRLSSWGSISNCCEWKGVVCDNRTNHVEALHLRGPEFVLDQLDRFETPKWRYPAAPLRGNISPSLLQLPHLQYLDLSLNNFSGTTIPSFIGSLTKLRHLSLSFSNFGGQIPHHIGNLSALQLLDLGGNSFLTDTNLDWLSGSPSLQYLDLTQARLRESTTWLQVMDKLTALREIHMSYCHLAIVAPVSLTSLNSSSNSLVVLDLSSNTFLDSSVLLRFLNMSSSFTYIDFSNNHLGGEIPDALGNLVSLSLLRLQFSNLNTSIPDVLLGNLTSLSYLDLSYNDLHGEFPRHSKNSSSLTYLDLSSNRFNGQLPDHLVTWLWDSTSLRYLSLSENLLSGSFPNMSRFSVLKELYLGQNGLSGALLEGNLRLPNLERLDLSANKFTGRLPSLSSSPLLRFLSLNHNTFSGNLIESIGHLSKIIEYLVVGYNQLEGVITEAHLSSLPHLRLLDLSFNLDISIRISPFWIHPVQFQELMLAYCKLGPQFPKWLQTQNQLQFLDISNSGILDTIPSWFWGNVQWCMYLNMSHNQIRGVLPDLSSAFTQLLAIDLSSNEFTGSLPPLPPVFYKIDLSRNRFSSGTVLNFCNFNGSGLLLDLSNNQLSGEIPPDCFMNLLSLAYVNLANNNFSGEIPSTNNLACRVISLHLRNNSFRGEIPRSSLMNCSALRILDLGENEFIGNIPVWLGERIPELGVLILKSNMFHGSLPSSLCHLANIQVLDISLNNIIGTIPNCMNNFTRLSSEVNPAGSWEYLSINRASFGPFHDSFHDSASVIWKGNVQTYINTLGLLKIIDLSSNELSGEIPPELTSLIGLVGLNLSRNNLVGVIPKEIDELRNLNFLDLSRNNLSGTIPPTLSKLSHLGVLDLSFNNLWGRIPWDSHLQTFEASSFSGNPRLCGPPLLWRPCPEDEKPGNGSDDSEEKFINRGFYISLLLGFIVAFWVVFWTSFFNKWWNVWSMRICMTVGDWLYVHILVNKRRLMMRFFGNA